MFGLVPNNIGGLRYQLFHRTASAIIEAKRYRASKAAMIVQSWSPLNDGFDDYIAFFEALGVAISEAGRLSDAIIVDGVSFRTAWSAETS